MFRRMRVLLPTMATGSLRVSQLLVLLAIVQTTTGRPQSVLVVGFGLLGAFSMLTDSGAGNFILSGGVETRIRAVVRRAVGFHALTTAGGMVAAAVLAAAADGPALASVWAVFAGLALTQLLDSVSRIVRSPVMAAGDDLAYSLPDLALVAVKVVLIVLSLATGSAMWLSVLFLPSLLQVAASWSICRRRLVESGTARPRLIRRIAEFGLTGGVSAFYAQAPLLVATMLWPPAVVAPISVAYRVVQAFDLLPATASLQLIPRVHAGRLPLARTWLLFTGATVLLSAVIIGVKPVIDVLLHGVVPSPLLFATVALAFVPRSGNFVLNAFAMGGGRIRARTIATMVTAVVAVCLAVVATVVGGAELFGLVSFTAESFFAVLLVTLLRRGADTRPAPVTAQTRPTRAKSRSSVRPLSSEVAGR